MDRNSAYAAYCAHGITPPITRVGERIEHAFGAGWEAAKEAAAKVALAFDLDESDDYLEDIAKAILALSQGSGIEDGGGVTQADQDDKLTPAFCAASPLQKWELLTLHGVLGTDEPWIENMRDALREQEAALQAALTRQPAPAEVEDMVGRLRATKTQVLMRSLFGGAIALPDEGETREVLVNPDGPAAADMLAALSRNQGGGR